MTLFVFVSVSQLYGHYWKPEPCLYSETAAVIHQKQQQQQQKKENSIIQVPPPEAPWRQPEIFLSAMESGADVTGLSTAALVAIGCNALVGALLLLLCLVLYRACRVPSSPDRRPVLASSHAGAQQPRIEHQYLLTS